MSCALALLIPAFPSCRSWSLGVAGLVAFAVGLGCGDSASPAPQSGNPQLPDLSGNEVPGAAGEAGAGATPGVGGDPNMAAGSTQEPPVEAVDPNLPLTPGTPMAAPQAVPGVVVIDDPLIAGRCAPLCVGITSPATDPDGNGDDWGYEGSSSCVIPGTITARGNQECTTGAPLPPQRQIPGVVVVDMGVPRCAPLCLLVLDIASDADADGWFYENNLSCVIPGTPTAVANQACTTGGAVPDAEPRPGLLLADGLGAACRPVCEVVTTPSSPDAPDWGYEQNASCVLPTSATAAASSRTCTFGGPALTLVPPALTGNKVAAGFFVQGARLLDAYGQEFVIRGVNNPHVWYDTGAQYQAYAALDTIAGYGTNTIRVVWETTGPVALLREVLHRIVELDMVPMVELHDVTSSQSRAELVDMAEYYASADVREVLNDFREYAIVNIANEWSGNDFLGAYQEAVSYLRSNGISHTLVIDANGFGQNGQAILDNAAALTNADPQRNLLFSVHMYESFGTAAAVDNMLNTASTRGIPLIVGEFGWQHNGRAVAWERILTRTNELGVGYIAWSWLGNEPATAALDMATGPNGPLTDWGQDVMAGAPGNIQSTSRPASIFE